MVGRIYTDDPEIGINDVGVELVRVGLAMPQPSYTEYKYGELTQAMNEARARKLGVWRDQQ